MVLRAPFASLIGVVSYVAVGPRRTYTWDDKTPHISDNARWSSIPKWRCPILFGSIVSNGYLIGPKVAEKEPKTENGHFQISRDHSSETKGCLGKSSCAFTLQTQQFRNFQLDR